jgi:two-component system NtrC family sensor kinase
MMAAPEASEVELREELERARQQLIEAHKMASLGRLLAGIVHEINTPIGSILSNNDVIVRSLDLIKKSLADCQGATERSKDILETCRSLASVDKIACERISSMIRSLKMYARVGSDERRKTDLNELLLAMLKLMHGEFRRRIHVETELGELPEVECYPHLLSQVFLNLLVNAGQAIEGEGKITVRTRRANDHVHISIRDTGSGIPRDIQAKIFGCGFTTKPLGVGTGLGLSIARQIVEEKHAGRISFESEPGQGTTFHVYIPVLPKEPA